MKPLRPALFDADNIADGCWLAEPANRPIRDLLRFSGASFPSVIMGFAARDGLEAVADMVASGVSQAGLNVFLSDSPTPICALSQAVGQRGMPLGLYLDESPAGGFYLQAVANHGGPMTDRDLPETEPKPLEKLGVVGAADITSSYLVALRKLIDPFPEDKPRVASIVNPFATIEKRLREPPEIRILCDRDDNGPTATISPDGQSLGFLEKDGKSWSTSEMVGAIGEYLTHIRRTSGTVLAPHGTIPHRFPGTENVQVEGTSLDMSSTAAWVDLLLGWWEPGIVAHQGNSPFGDAFLTLAYLLEALGSRKP